MTRLIVKPHNSSEISGADHFGAEPLVSEVETSLETRDAVLFLETNSAGTKYLVTPDVLRLIAETQSIVTICNPQTKD